MTVPQSDGNLPAARRRLNNAISALINPTTQPANGEAAIVPPLYQQLYDAIPGMQGIGHSAARSLPPLWLDAAKALAEVDVAARKWVPKYDHCRECRHCAQTPPTITRLQTLNERRWRPQDVRHIEDIADRIETWVIDITVLLTPEPVRALWAAEGGGFAACPACDKTMAKKRDNTGEIVGTPALQLNKDGSTHCQACNTDWGPHLAMWVCRQLGYPLPNGVLQ